MFFTLSALIFSGLGAVSALPLLEVSGFSWAENLAFDGRGSLFVSDVATGELSRIYLCGDTYCKSLHVADSIDSFGGLAVSPDGQELYAGVTFSDKSHGVIKTSTLATPDDGSGNESGYTIVTQTPFKPNGMAADWSSGILYCTHEGYSEEEGGSVFMVNVNTMETSTLKAGVDGADGCWFDQKSSILFVGELMTLKIWAYDAKHGKEIGEFQGAANLKKVRNMLDDITLQANGTDVNNLGDTMFYGADFMSSEIISFSLDGTKVDILPLPESLDLRTPTSVRYGKGPGFCEHSLYVTEGGGLSSKQSNRRVVQIKL